MGIGRREFLRCFGATLTALAAGPSRAVALLDDQYINRKLGIAFTKPRGWFFSDVREMGEIVQGQLLDLHDEELARELVESADLPIVTISREPVSLESGTFTPGVNIYLDKYFLQEDHPVGFSLSEIRTDIHGNETILKDFQVLSNPRLCFVSGCEAVDYSASFLFEHRHLRTPVRVRMRTLAVFQKPAWYTFRLYDSPYLGPEQTYDYTTFIGSIQMV